MRIFLPLTAALLSTGCTEGFTGIDVTMFSDVDTVDAYPDAALIRRIDFLTEYPAEPLDGRTYGVPVGLNRAPLEWWGPCLLEDDGCTTSTSWGSRPFMRQGRITYLTLVHVWVDVNGDESSLSMNDDPRPDDDDPQVHGYVELMEGQWGDLSVTLIDDRLTEDDQSLDE
ncbi:MAG: hypothetical protein AAFV53_07515 [Myxococcota bacterium]